MGSEIDRLPPEREPLSEREVEILQHVAALRSDREIAEALFLSLNTIKWYNKQIFAKLDVGGRRQAVERARALGWLEAPPKSSTGAEAPPKGHLLPAVLTSFIGRAGEIDEVGRLLASTRLLTLTGPGGVGKTRLALEVARSAADGYPDGVYLVELAPIAEPDLVARALAQALGLSDANLPPEEALKRHLRDKRLLLVADNFEHLPDAAALVSELLEAAPGLAVLATSRAALNLYGEQVYPLPPLDRADSIELFGQRARLVKPGFALDVADREAVSQICARLDDLPLAVELAAARARLLSPADLLARLTSRLDTLTSTALDLPARHQSLRAAVDWSYHLLDPAEQQLFNRLSVFAGGCTVEAAEAVCADGLPLDILDGLGSLLDKSLLRALEDGAGQPRFLLLETLREYALEQLEASGEAGTIRQRHAAAVVALAERAEPELRGGKHHALWARRLEQERDNIRAAFGWLLRKGGDPLPALRLSGALSMFWWARELHEGRRWAEQALAKGADAPPGVQARALNSAALMAHALGDYRPSQAMFREALRLARQAGDVQAMTWSMAFLGYAPSPSNITSDEVLLWEALELSREAGDLLGETFVLNSLGALRHDQGDYQEAKIWYERAVALRRADDVVIEPVHLINLASVVHRLGDGERAWALYEEALALSRASGQIALYPFCLSGLALLIGERGQSERAAQLLGAVETNLQEVGFQREPGEQADYERDLAALRARLDEATFDANWAAGRALSLEEAIDLALRE